MLGHSRLLLRVTELYYSYFWLVNWQSGYGRHLTSAIRVVAAQKMFGAEQSLKEANNDAGSRSLLLPIKRFLLVL